MIVTASNLGSCRWGRAIRLTNPSGMVLIVEYKKEGFATDPARGSAPRNCGFASRLFRSLFPALRFCRARGVGPRDSNHLGHVGRSRSRNST